MATLACAAWPLSCRMVFERFSDDATAQPAPAARCEVSLVTFTPDTLAAYVVDRILTFLSVLLYVHRNHQAY